MLKQTNYPHIRPELAEYLKSNIFPMYDNCDPAHRIEHINNVIKRSLEFAAAVKNIDPEIVLVAAAYHDIGCAEDRKKHEQISAYVVRNDISLRKFFTKSQIDIIANTVANHRSSAKHERMSVYDEIISAADKPTNISIVVERLWQYRIPMLKNMNLDKIIDDAYEYLCEKYNSGGFDPKGAIFLKNDPTYTSLLKQIGKLCANKATFGAAFRNAALAA